MVARAIDTTGRGLAWTARRFMRIADKIADIGGITAHFLLILLIPLGFLNVLLRYLGRFLEHQLSNNIWVQAQWYIYGLAFLLMFPYMLYNNQSLRVAFWYKNRSPTFRAWVDFVGHMLSLIPFSVLGIWFSWKPVALSWANWERYADQAGLPVAPIKAFIMVAFFLLGIQTIACLIRLILFLGSDDQDLEGVLTEHQEPARRHT